MTTAVKEEAKAVVEPPAPRLRLEFLDGLRGIAALAVVYHHAQLLSPWGMGEGTPGWKRVAGGIALALSHGRASVAIFIVLSGYCLMLPVARAKNGALRGGWGEYLKRRARRILPPYYAALVVSIGLLLLVPSLREPTGGNWDNALPGLSKGAIASHALLLHNFKPEWAEQINPPMWSVATEWQIYFLFPLALLPLWRRFGVAMMTTLALAAGIGFYLLTRHGEAARVWYVGLFALGMAGACVSFRPQPHLIRARDAWPWGGVALLWSAAYGLLAWMEDTGRFEQMAGDSHFHLTLLRMAMDMTAGLAAACLLIACAKQVITKRGAFAGVVQLFESRPAEGLGRFSYSLYLCHMPILALLAVLWRRAGCDPGPTFALQVFVGVPISLAVSWLFYLAVERRFTVRP